MDETLTEVMAVFFGLFLRIGLPILITVSLAWLLRRLDARWQAEAEAEAEALRHRVLHASEAIPCWEIQGCPSRMRARCAAYQNPDVPCWEARRTHGRMQPACSDCKVRRALLPAPA